MTARRNLCIIFAFVLCFYFIVFNDISSAKNNNASVPIILLDKKSIDSCELTLEYSKLISSVGCGGSVDSDIGAGMAIVYYQYGLEHNDFYKHFEAAIYRQPLNEYVIHGAGGVLVKLADGAQVMQSSVGAPQLSDDELVGACGQENSRKIEVTPIQGVNWTGWMWEQTFSKPKKKLKKSCEKYTPDYRCVALVFGNDKLSASMPTYCFLRKRVDNLDTELSFDIFMDMVKTIRFNEGSVQANTTSQ